MFVSLYLKSYRYLTVLTFIKPTPKILVRVKKTTVTSNSFDQKQLSFDNVLNLLRFTYIPTHINAHRINKIRTLSSINSSYRPKFVVKLNTNI